MPRNNDASINAYSYRQDSNVPAFADDRPIIVFDGDCAFCSGWVQFALRRAQNAGGDCPAPGARAAIDALELGDYEAVFAGKQLYAGIRDDTPASVRPRDDGVMPVES